MGSHSEADGYISQLNPLTRELAVELHRVLTALGCSSYVKTIYVGYDVAGEMVAAMYGHPDRVEVALALPEDAAGDLLVDASHLTWRTLPVAAEIRNKSEIALFQTHAEAACERVRNNAHDVYRTNEYFVRSREQRRSRPGPDAT